MREAKAALRARIREVRAAIPEAERRVAAVRVAAGVLLQPGVVALRGVLAYAATPEELDPSVLVELLRGSGVRVAYPRVCGPTDLSLHWSDADELRPGYCGLLEPASGALPAAPDEIGLVIVPGVAFDQQCHRLGMGGGFYDRLFATLPSTTMRIGIAFGEQIVDAVPREAHDMVLDAVVTPDRVIRRPAPPAGR